MSSNKDNTLPHKSVMLHELLASLAPKDNEVYIDCTFGAGGHSTAILKTSNCIVYGIDRDKTVEKFTNKLKEEFPKRFHFINGKFGNLENLLKQQNIGKVDGIILDLGVSSMQLDEGPRGFSFQKKARLDMRMGSGTLNAYDVVNKSQESHLADILYNYGDEVKARQIAKAIIEKRKKKPIETTTELASIVREFYPKASKTKIDPATKTFQAIRIFVNDELEELTKVLNASINVLKKGGRLVVITFHSLEDKIVKDFMRRESGYSERKISKYKEKTETFNFTLGVKKAIAPSDEEILDNIRSRSAKLRYVIKN
ncbi:16S rRNA (cytosine(1402)-N(4))-methyltransferase RsmH [Pseudomonadota bacterium]